MHPVIAKTFGGLTARYYFRHFIFGLAFTIFIYTMVSQSSRPLSPSVILIMTVNTVLYPYSRFVYEGVANFIIGDNMFYMSAILALALKVGTITFCWLAAIFVSPIGLAYLYFYHSKSGH